MKHFSLLFFAAVNFATTHQSAWAAEVSSLAGIYTSAQQKTSMVLIQQTGKANLLTCSTQFGGQSEADARQFVRNNCVPYEALAADNYIVRKRYVYSSKGKPVRMVLTAAGSLDTQLGDRDIVTDATSWTLDLAEGGSDVYAPRSPLILTTARVANKNLENPTVSTQRAAFDLQIVTRMPYQAIEE